MTELTITCVCWGMFRKLLSRDPMLTNLLGAVEPGVEYAEREREEEETKNINKKTRFQQICPSEKHNIYHFH